MARMTVLSALLLLLLRCGSALLVQDGHKPSRHRDPKAVLEMRKVQTEQDLKELAPENRRSILERFQEDLDGKAGERHREEDELKAKREELMKALNMGDMVEKTNERDSDKKEKELRLEIEAMKLQQADATRLEPEKTMGKLTMKQLQSIPLLVQIAHKSPLVRRTIEAQSDLIKKSAVTMLYNVKDLAEYMKKNRKAPKEKFYMSLARLIEGSWDELTENKNILLSAAQEIEDAMPNEGKDAIKPFVHMMALQVEPLDVNFTLVADLATEKRKDACEVISTVMGDFERKVKGIRETLNTTNAIAPILSTLVKRQLKQDKQIELQLEQDSIEHDGSPVELDEEHVQRFIRDMTRVGYLELVALDELSLDVLNTAGPEIVSRVGCTWSGSPRMQGMLSSLAIALMALAASLRLM